MGAMNQHQKSADCILLVFPYDFCGNMTCQIVASNTPDRHVLYLVFVGPPSVQVLHR